MHSSDAIMKGGIIIIIFVIPFMQGVYSFATCNISLHVKYILCCYIIIIPPPQAFSP